MNMAKGNSVATPTCMICKNDLDMVSKINIFKTRTDFSKTLLSAKLTNIVQDQFSPLDLDIQDICTSCSLLLNLVDECDCKLMALNNEVKLKYKLPFAIQVQDKQPAGAAPPNSPPPVGWLEEVSVAEDIEQPAQQSAQQQHVISIPDGSGYGNANIVIESSQLSVDTEGNMIISSSAPESESEEHEFKQSQKRKRSATRAARSDRPRIRHADAQWKKVVTCSICDQIFINHKSMTAHMATHAGNKKSRSCGFCENVFTNHIHLHKHWNEEHPLQLLPCPHCEQRFATKSRLRMHMNIHKEARFICEVCARPFHAAGDLRKHFLIKHTDEKKFECSSCPMKFKMNWLLTRHRVRVHATIT